MVIQARAEASRQAILAAAAEAVDDVGFLNLTLADVVERAGFSKGRFVYHFPNKEALATGLMEAADFIIAETVRQALLSTTSALEGLIRSSFTIAELAQSDPVVRVGIQLRDGLGGSAGTTEGMTARLAVTAKAISDAIAQGDVRADCDPEDVGYTVVVSMRGNFLHCAAAGADARPGLATLWPVLLDGIVTERSADYFKTFLLRLAEQSAVRD